MMSLVDIMMCLPNVVHTKMNPCKELPFPYILSNINPKAPLHRRLCLALISLIIKLVLFLVIWDRVGIMPGGGDKGNEGVEGSHKGVIEHVFTLICVAGGWWCHGKGAAA